MMNQNAQVANNASIIGRSRESRRHMRYVTKVRCKVQPFSGVRLLPAVGATIRNISRGGALIECTIPLKTKDHLYLLVGKNRIKISAAVVSWTQQGYHLKFLKDLTPDMTEEIAFDRL